MNILIIGSGGREHSISWKIAQSELCDELYVAPGNGGMGDIAKCVSLNDSDHKQVIQFCRDKNIEFVVIGPEAPLVGGLSDALTSEGICTFGPS
ncbi:MAG: phosphoribosylamine--glycine ligase family protein, partial [Emcibacteraceae bacterium]|nr:phosphoribosylamine--glycine ligase family protein [Emcibacteraceae bacterium]